MVSSPARTTLLGVLYSCLAFSALVFGRTTGHSVRSRNENAIAPGIPLRILPLGDSITWGFQSSDGNGYRLDLLNDLTAGGSDVTYIGSMKSGNMTNNENDGFVGWTISEIANGTKPTLAQLPNVILLHAGTNDMNLDPPRQPYDTAPERLGDLLDELLGAVPGTTIVVAQIIQSGNAGTKDRIPVFNDAVPDIVAQRTDSGAKIQLVDMSSVGVNGVHLADGLHPNDTGYNLMANFWLDGLQQASDKGWITAPR